MSPTPETGLAFVDGRDALAYVILRPTPDDPDRITAEAAARGMSKAAAACALRSVADEFDTTAAAEGDEPIPHPAGLDAQLAAHTRRLADMLRSTLDRGVPAEAPSVGKYLASVLDAEADRLTRNAEGEQQ